MTNRTAIIAGATGLVGKAILQGLLDDPDVGKVYALGRRAPPITHPKLDARAVDFTSLPTLLQADEVYLALGTTIKQAGSQAAFRAVDYDANLAVARAALAAGAKRAGLVSAMGADVKSSLFYSRVKGELEAELARLPFLGIAIARPSLLVGDREGLGQPTRPGEVWGMRLNSVLGPLIPANYKPIEAADVAAALLAAVPSAKGTKVMLSGAMRRA
jgi:uncharacterized protein YbjT (DUF2867 family)